MKKTFCNTLALLCVLAQGMLTACKNKQDVPQQPKSIVILYENDVHCAIDNYAKLAGLRDAIEATDTAWVAVVCSGDYLQGGVAGSLSEGQYIVDIMRQIHYDAVTIGNHEFDYGGERMKELVAQIQAPVVCTNYFDAGAAAPYYAPYVICRYGDRRVAYVGVLAPETMMDESYSFYDEDGNLIYDLHTDEVPQLVQTAVDQARKEGADYVVLLSHMGEKQPILGISSHDLVAATRGIDAVLDGHTHSVIIRDEVANRDGQTVPVTQTGTQFANIGKMVISPDGRISTTLINPQEFSFTSAVVQHTIDSVYQLLDEVTHKQLATCPFELTINGPDGKRLVRNGETNMADIITDAFREIAQAQIGLCNGGGIRASIPAGIITYGDVINVQPFNNQMVRVEASGSTIIAMLESCTASLPDESGSFPQVAGLRYTVHQRSHTVTNVDVYDDVTGTWMPILPTGTYTIGTTDYCAEDGMNGVLQQCPRVTLPNQYDGDTFADYLETTLGGVVPNRYASPQGRITILDD